jgi:phosphate transport system substrate-binding protein
VIGGVVPVVNLHGIGAGELKLSGEILSGIFLGRITRWNDPAIAELNPSLHLPGSRITVVHRSDASGTSFLWTDYLSREDPRWKQDIGRGTTVAWPTGVGGVGNEGVASYVQRTRASLGYVEYAYAEAHRLSDVSLRDVSGTFIRADADTFAAALASAHDDASTTDATLLLTNTGRGWPIAGASFILISTAARDADTQRAAIAFFCWALRNGQPLAHEMHYVPIPEQAAARIVEELTARKP